MMKKYKERLIIMFIQILILILFLFFWDILAKYKVINRFLFSSPKQIIDCFRRYLGDYSLFKHIYITLKETILGLFIGMISGILISILLWWNKLLAKILDPFLVVLNALPKTALAPILIIWVGTSIKGIIACSISISIVLTIIQSYQYFINVDEEKIMMLKSYGASKSKILFNLILPSNLLNLVSLLKINIGMSFVGVIVGEFIVSKAGIGYLIMYGSQVFNMSLVMMGIITLAILSFILYIVVNYIEKKLKRGRKKK